MRRGPKRIPIKTGHDFSCVADDMITEFLQSFTFESGLVRKPTEEDFYDFEHRDIDVMFTQKGMALYDRYCERLSKLGMKYFCSSELDIQSSYIKFP